MAVRRWRIHPDVQFPVAGEMTAVVSRDALVEGILDGVAMLDRSGGVLTVIVGRTPTELEGEMVTTGAVVEWKNRSDAKPQPEQPSHVPVVSAGLFEPTEPEETVEKQTIPYEEPTMRDLDEQAVAEALAAEPEPSPDGLDYNTLPDEDVSDIPLHAR